MDKIYPISGYAPGNYRNKCCNCNELFHGNKRAVQCEDCAIKSVFSNLWIDVNVRKPTIGNACLVRLGDVVLKGRLCNNGWSAFFKDGEYLVGETRPVTHWIPLGDNE